MADIVFDIASAFVSEFPTELRNGFGALPGATQLLTREQQQFPGLQAIQARDVEEYNALGLPIFDLVTFRGGIYDTIENGQVVPIEIPDRELPLTSMISCSRSKQITKSTPSGATGSVKELWAFQDWKVQIRGLIMGDDPLSFPEQEVRQIKQLETIADSIEVSSELFYILGIKRLVITQARFATKQGSPYVLPFFLSCESDEPIELQDL